MPVYLVSLKRVEPSVRLIDAPNQAAAVAHAIKDWVSAEKPAARDLVALGKDGVEVEQAKAGE